VAVGSVLIGEAVYLMILSAGAERGAVRVVAALGLCGAIWAASGYSVAAVVVAVVAALIFEVCARVVRNGGVAGGWLAAVLAQGGVAVWMGRWLIPEAMAKGLLLGTPYPGMFVVAAFWVPSALREAEACQGEREKASAGPAAPAVPVVVTSAATFVTMMLQAYALLPFGALAGLLLEKDLSLRSVRLHGIALAACVVVGAAANEMSYWLSL